MSTHTLKIAEDVCHRVGIINKGNLIAVGTIDELKQKTNTEKADLEEAFLTITR